MPSKQQVTLVLRGAAADIMDVVQLALAGNLIASMQQDNGVAPHDVNAAHVRRTNKTERHWSVGQKVRVVQQVKSQYPNMPPVGSEGTVTSVHRNGLNSGVSARFTIDGKTSTVRIAGRLLKAVKK